VLEVCRGHLEFLGWRGKNNWEEARTFKFIFCEPRNGICHIRGQCASGDQVCSVGKGLAHVPYWSPLENRYHEIRLLQLAVVGGTFWYHEECSA